MASALEKLRKARQGSGTSLASANIGGSSGGLSGGSSGSSALAKLRAARSGRTQQTLTPAAQRYAVNNTSSAALKNGPSGTPVPTGESSKNRGGLLGGIGYVGEKIGLGFMQGLEGVVDYVGAGIAEIFGNDEASERIISNDWMNYSHADEWFNPGEGWRIAGDVGGGIGTSLPGLAAGVAVTWATGGSGIGAGIGLALSGFSAAGTSTKEAYLESGELGGKEFGYGAAMGVVEAATEKLSGSLGKGLLRGIDDIAGAFGKTASKTAKALTVKTVAKDLGGEFLSEAFEEGFAEFVSPYAKRLTYDPNAKNATIEEISYAALVGGLSGLAMGGGRVGVTQLGHNVQGNKAVDAGRVTSIMDTAKAFSDYEGEHPTKLSSLEAIRDLYTRLDAQGVRTATELTGNQRRALGELQALTTSAVFEPAMQKSALSAIAGADAIAEKLNADGNVKIVDGRMQVVTSDILAELQKKGTEVRDITADDIRGGVDVKDGKSIEKAMKEKDVLRYVVASDVAGRFLMTAKEVETAARAGTKIKSQADLNAFIENASEEQKRALGAELGIADNEWATLKLNRFNEAAAAYRESGKLDAKRAEMQAQKEKASVGAEGMPTKVGVSADVAKTLKTAKNAGLTNTKQENVSVSDKIAPGARMSMDAVGASVVESGAVSPTVSTNERVAELKERLDAKKIDSYAAENIEGYSSLGEANKSMIRQVVREGRATGISDEDTLRYARVAAKTGVNVTFDKQETYKGKNEVGEDVYHAAVYDPENNRIIVNPETKKKHTVLLMHELSHAMRKYVKGGNIKYAFDEDTKLSKDMWKAIEKYYAGKDGKLDAELALDEASAYYAEALFGTDTAIDLLLGKKQTLKEKILSFFAKSAEYYSSDSALSREARRQFRKYKKMFDSFAERNQYRNAEARVEGAGDGSRRASFSSIAFSFYGVDNMTAEEFESKDYKETEGYKAYVDECLNNMRQTQRGFDEKAARAEIEKSIDGIVSVAVAMKKAGYDIADTAEKRSAKDTQNRLLFSSLEPNSDYFTSSDISTICDKRQNFAEIYDDIVRAEESRGVPVGKRFFDNVDNYFYIHKVLADKGLTQPCRQCYVESMRKNLAPMANAFLTLVRETDGGNKSNPQLYNQSGKNKGALKSNNAATREEVRKILDGYGVSAEDLTVKMLTTADGLAEIKITMPELYERFNAFYGQSKPKMPKGATPFRFGELTALLTDNKGNIKTGLVKKINSTGGFRLQSYSDFQIKNYADVLQVLFEAGTLGLNGHAYTKVPAFLDATADTNLKRNISIFMYNDNGQWKIDRNDSFPYTLDEIYDVVKADKSGNTGVIAVVQNEDMAAYVMANENIGYFIPFHKSGIKMGVVRDTIVKEGGREIKGYKDIKDHTRQQTEVWATTTADHKANTKVSKPINIYEEGLWDFDNSENLPTKKLIEKNVKAYIDACEKSGYLPKFREYVMNNGKVLRDVLKYSKELGFVSDSATVNDISFEYKGYRIPYGYYKCLGDFSMITPSGKASGIEPISLANYKFDKAVKFFSDAETVRRNEILQQFSNGTEREYYRESTMTAEELQKVIDTKRTEVVNEIVDKSAKRAAMEVDKEYLDAVNRGDMETAQRMVDEAAKQRGYDSPRLYHGTASFGFTKFNPELSDDGISIFATNESLVAETYSGQTKNRKLSDKPTITPEALEQSSAEKLLELLKEHFSDDYRLVTKEEKNTIIDVIKKPLIQSARSVENFYAVNMDMFNEKKRDALFAISKAIREVASAENYNDLMDRQMDYEKALWDLKWLDESVSDEITKIIGNTESIAFSELSTWVDNDVFHADAEYAKENHTPWMNRNEAISALYPKIFSGVYALYAKTANRLEFDAEGSYWSKIDGRKIGISRELKTRDVAKYAKEKGYDSVLIKNLFDNGSDSYNGMSDIYIFFGGDMLKSADPVTYDDKGDVIPLSERFNPKNKDIRFSMDITPELEAARDSIVMDLSSYKPKGRKETIEYGKAVGDDAYTRFQIQATNQQAGLEKELKRLGVKNGEALVQSARSASNAAATMIGDVQMRIGDGSYEVQGEGLEKIYHPILNGDAIESELKGLSKKEREARLEEYSSDFFAYLFHMHSADRMSLEEKSIVENKKNIEGLAEKVQRRKDIETELKSISDDITSISRDMDAKLREIKQLGKSRKKEINELRKELRGEWQDLRSERKKLYEQQSVLRKEKSELNALLKDAIMENKPVLGHAVDADGNTVLTTAEDEAIPYTAEESKAIAEEILKLHPEFKEAAEKVWAYNKNLNQYRVDAGLISQESFDRMQELYPHYVPTYREGSRTGIAAMSGKYALKVKATVKSAKGGLRPLCRPDVIMARQTEETIKAGRVNQLARTYYDAAETETNKGVNAMRVISRVDAKADETIDFDPTTIAPKNNRVTFYKNGEKIEMEVDKNVFDGFDAFNSQTDMGGIITGTLGKVMDLYKRLITSYSPIFTIRNAIRDLQDAGINTKYGKTFLRNYKRAMREISSNGKYWQMYRAAGGLSSSLFDFEKGFGGSTNSWGLTKAEGNPLQKLGTTIENANVFIEQLPRLAEFISSMEAKNSIEQAILDAADVTTNFGRSGKMARWLNRNFIPFLNPSIQGFSKLIRNVTDKKTAKELVAFLIKAALLGFVPQIINQLLLGDDDEYEKLRDSDKENNYIIRAGDQFIKIPKGRVVAAMSGIVNRTANTVQGKEDAWEGYLDSVLQNITPVDSASRDIFSPFRDVKANKTWYGTEIEGGQFEGVPVEERTDEGTSWIAEVLAQLPTSKAADYSPKKIHYLIDQYTGIIGDIVLPATSKKAQKDMFSGAFVIDPVVSNDLSNRFYKQYDKAVETRNSTKSTEEEIEIASFRYKYLGKIKDTVSDMQKLKREIQASDLKATEKLKQTREIQAAINLMYEEALADIDKLTELYNGTYYLGAADIYSNYVASGITDEQYASLRYAETIRSYYGAETALSQYNSAVYEKAVLFNKAGLDYDTYYEYYFTTRGIESDVDRHGEVVAGSKKKKTLAAIRALGVSQNERLLLTAAAGYALSDGEKRRLLSHIMRLGVSKEEKAAIAEACGFKVKNGRISMK